MNIRYKILIVLTVVSNYCFVASAQRYVVDEFIFNLGQNTNDYLYEMTESYHKVDSLQEEYTYTDSSRIFSRYIFNYEKYAYGKNRNDSIITFIIYFWEGNTGFDFLCEELKSSGYEYVTPRYYIHSDGEKGAKITHTKNGNYAIIELIKHYKIPPLLFTGKNYTPPSATDSISNDYYNTIPYVSKGALILATRAHLVLKGDSSYYSSEEFYIITNSEEKVKSILMDMSFRTVNMPTDERVNSDCVLNPDLTFSKAFNDKYYIRAVIEKCHDRVDKMDYHVVKFRMISL
jgi:hypothetical protein